MEIVISLPTGGRDYMYMYMYMHVWSHAIGICLHNVTPRLPQSCFFVEQCCSIHVVEATYKR